MGIESHDQFGEGAIHGTNTKPWYWKSRKSWYVTINGERHNLGSDKKEAKDEFHRLMTSPTAKLKNDSAAGGARRLFDVVRGEPGQENVYPGS